MMSATNFCADTSRVHCCRLDRFRQHTSNGSSDISQPLRFDGGMYRHAQHGQLSTTFVTADPTADTVYALPHQAVENVGFSQQELDIWNLLTNDLLPRFPSVTQPFDNPVQSEAYSTLDLSKSYQTSRVTASTEVSVLSPNTDGTKYGRLQAASPLEPSGEGLQALTAAKTMLSDLVSCKNVGAATRYLPHLLNWAMRSLPASRRTCPHCPEAFLISACRCFGLDFYPHSQSFIRRRLTCTLVLLHCLSTWLLLVHCSPTSRKLDHRCVNLNCYC